ncbi:MAG: dodecin family protein [Thermacetogeniaceae bacterium]|jgi:flavin-binding protein dodecin|nr:dodecin family protein [Thermoanaerobacterales bacterium]NLN20926.1 dodecin domain-containing protein [Syntrophomonadaceae bacterium]HAF17762.1 hypothetical protein [Peptococcaceae bacterium]
MVVKVMDLVGESTNSWDEAIKGAVQQASKSINNITGVEVANLTAGVRDGQIYEYKANVRIAYKDA